LALDLLRIGTLEEQLDCLSQVGGRLLDPSLTGHVQLGAQRRVQSGVLPARLRRWQVCSPSAAGFVWRDAGRVIKPLIVEGQCTAPSPSASAAHWPSSTDDEAGQLLTGTLMEYALPTAATMPASDIDHIKELAANLAGVRGVGDAARSARLPCSPTP
jgi:hypothetical protein